MKSVKNIGLVLAIIIVLALTIIQHNLTRAEKYSSILSMVEANVPEVEVPTGEARAARQSQANIAEVEKMVGAWQSKKMAYGQWMHTVDKRTTEEDRGVVLPNGQQASSRRNARFLDELQPLGKASRSKLPFSIS